MAKKPTKDKEDRANRFVADPATIEWLGKVEGGFSDFQPDEPAKPVPAPPKKG